MNKIRIENEKKYNELKTEEITIDNAIICEKIAEDNILWWPDEALYWKKEGIKIRESIKGKKCIDNTPYYDMITETLLEKGSYKEALKWNKKSAVLKEKYGGIDNPEILKNKLLLSENMFLLEDYITGKQEADNAYNILNNNLSILEDSLIYNSCLSLTHLYSTYNIAARYNNYDPSHNNEICGDKAIELSKKIFGDNSFEVAETYRKVAITLGDNPEKCFRYFQEALKIYVDIKVDKKVAVQIFHDIRNKCRGENILIESAKWMLDHSSKDFLYKALEDFNEKGRNSIKDALKL